MKLVIKIIEALFFSLILVACSSTKKIELKPIYQTWDGGFLLNFRSYQIGVLPSTSKIDPLFTDVQLDKHIISEIDFNSDNLNLKRQVRNADASFYYYFVSDSLYQPVLPYIARKIPPEIEEIRYDTLAYSEFIFVLDLVENGTNELAWRAYTKVDTTKNILIEVRSAIYSMMKEIPQ